ncbi:MAG TPA: hypothetical protein VFT79_10835 [Solirubrobacterales bacterium]|nr:hypothetical protein [Solirubrobacterales bacterium]
MRSERGQGTVEWVGLVLLVSVLVLGLVASGARVPGASLARALADRIVCAAALADGCGDEPALIAAYGTEVGSLVREHMPMLVFEQGSRALPVDFRRCRSTRCSDGPESGLVHRADERLPVTAFVHVIDCREGEAERTEAAGADCSGERAGNLYVQYWTYYPDSATLRDMPVVGGKGYHADDWESVQLRFRPGGWVDQRASSHHGYNHALSNRNWGSDAGFVSHDGWGAETKALFVSGGSHAGSAIALVEVDRFTPGRRVHLIPLEEIAATSAIRFAVSPPWAKEVWRDPEATGTS